MHDIYNISIVTYTNDTADLTRCLDSILKQKARVQIIVVDNLGSLAIKNVTSDYPVVDYYSLPNPGFGAAHNFASTKFTALGHRVFLNPDIIMQCNCLSKITDCFQSHPSVSLLSPKLLNLDGSEQDFIRNYPSLPNMFLRLLGRGGKHTVKNEGKFFSAKFMHGAFFIVNRKFAAARPGFDQRYFLYLEDLDFCISMQRLGDVGIATEARATHRHMKQSRKLSRLTIFHLQSFVKFWRKHGILWERN